MKTFVISQFDYYPLVWMFHSKKLNNRINTIHERALRVTYQDYKSPFFQLLQKDNSVAIHQRSLQVYATEVCKAKNDLSPEIMKWFFELRKSSFSLRSQESHFVRGNVITTHCGVQSIKHLEPKTWELLPN